MLHSFAPFFLATLGSSTAQPEPAASTVGTLVIQCPALGKLTCGESIDPNDTGFPTASGECDPSQPATFTFSDSVLPHDCGAERFDSFIIRTWTATDSCGNTASCEQTIDLIREIWNFDIKAPSCPNPFNLGGANGVVSMTIVGTAQHDVTDIDPSTIEIWTEHCDEGPVTPLRYNYEDKATPFMPGRYCACTTQGSDGILDLNFHFRKTDVQNGLDLGAYPPFTYVKIYVSARLSNGCGILGQDCVRVQ